MHVCPRLAIGRLDVCSGGVGRDAKGAVVVPGFDFGSTRTLR